MDILFCRIFEEKDKTFQKLQNISEFINPIHYPIFQLKLSDEYLEIPEDHAMIITSKNALRYWKKHQMNAKGRPIFLVGEKTAQWAKKLGFSLPFSYALDADELQNQLQNQDQYKKFTYLRGKKITANFSFLSHMDCLYEEYIIYDMVPILNVFQHLDADFFQKPHIILSYSTAQSEQIAQELRNYNHSKTRIITISEKAAEPFQHFHLQNLSWAMNPTENEIIKEIQKSL